MISSDPRKYHKTCLVRHDRLIGAITVGDLDGFAALRDLVASGTELEDMRDTLLRPGAAAAEVEGELVCSCNQLAA